MSDMILNKNGNQKPTEIKKEKEVEKVTEIPIDANAFEDSTKPQSDTSEFDITELTEEYKDDLNKGKVEVHGWESLGLSVPISSVEKLVKHGETMGKELGDKATEELSNVGSDINAIMEASRSLTAAAKLLKEALEKVTNLDKFAENKSGHGLSKANIGKDYRDVEEKTVAGDEALRIFTTLTGGVRKVTLWNSGFSIHIKNFSLDVLSSFLKEMNVRDYEYGKDYGGFYYQFADLSITTHIIERLLPLAITGSNYIDYKDTDKLCKAISFQDYPVILWALAAMMYPDGTLVKYICSEETCRHVEETRIDLEKLRLNNEDLINEDMRNFMADTAAKKVTDADLEKYRQLANLERDVEFEYGDVEEFKKKWKVTFKQCSLAEFMEVGEKFHKDLKARASITSREEVAQFIAYNQFQQYTPWIKSLTLTANVKGKIKTFTVENNEASAETISAMLDEFMLNVPEFGNYVKNYILSTKISHIAFYYPKCTKCGHVPDNSYGGFIPYDPMQNFFTLGLTRLLRATSKQSN